MSHTPTENTVTQHDKNEVLLHNGRSAASVGGEHFKAVDERVHCYHLT